MSTGGAAARAATLGERAWQAVDKINAELLVLTYGAVVAALVKETPAVDEVEEREREREF